MNATQELQTETLILGAGLTGLTTAHYLNKRKKDFLIIDKNNRVGGVIKTVEENGFLYEEGPNTGVIGNTTVVELFEELAGKCCVEPGGDSVKKRYILKDGKWQYLPLGLADAVKTPLFSLKDKFRVLGEPFRPAGKIPHENLASFVKRRLGTSFLEYAIDPFIIGVYAGDPNYLIPKYALPKLYNLEQKYGSLIGGSIRKGFEKKSEIEKKVSKKVFSFQGGMVSLVNALHESSGKEHFILGAENIKVSRIDDAYLTIFTNAVGQEIQIKSKNVICTIGAYALEKTLPFIDKQKMSKITSLHYTKVIEIALGFTHWDGIKLDGFGGLIPSKENRDILGILFMSSLFRNRNPKDGALLSIFMGGVRRQDLIPLSDENIRKVVEKECTDLLQLKTFNPDLYKIIRHQYAIPQYGIESGERFEAIKELEKKHHGLFLGGNIRDGIGMADRMNQGKMLAMEII